MTAGATQGSCANKARATTTTTNITPFLHTSKTHLISTLHPGQQSSYSYTTKTYIASYQTYRRDTRCSTPRSTSKVAKPLLRFEKKQLCCLRLLIIDQAKRAQVKCHPRSQLIPSTPSSILSTLFWIQQVQNSHLPGSDRLERSFSRHQATKL